MLNKQYYVEKAKVDRLVARKNTKADFYNGIYDRYEYPVLTREFAPVHWNMIWMRRRIRTLWSVSASTL